MNVKAREMDVLHLFFITGSSIFIWQCLRTLGHRLNAPGRDDTTHQDGVLNCDELSTS
jgi:hypothetical protein